MELPGARPPGAHGQLDTARNPDWMGALPDDRPLSRMSIPGTHDTLSIHGGRAGPAVVTQEGFDTGCADANCISRQSLRVQLEAGIRALDIRVRRDEADALAVHHGSFYQQANLDDVLGVVDDFLTRHPGETVLMRVKAECGAEGIPFGCVDAGGVKPDLARIDRALASSPRIWLPSATGRAEIPPLREVRGRIVITQFAGVDRGETRGLPLDEQDLWDGPDRETKWAAIAAHLDKAATAPPSTLTVNYLSANGAPDPTKLPTRYASYENQHTLDHLRSRPGAPAGILMTDFPGPALVSEIVRHNVA
ncbi:phosphatidylinositol-specific phospholipase C [Nocardia wallacei]|uniref:phosphatidylinositol-specific phospholipase C n=1 Tax=Nocardia wallacei TaxID=480035 RepID=UPI0024545CA2|nr:phosphatidylinositol-specific phospholipase C [Nocardia wallacei]